MFKKIFDFFIPKEKLEELNSYEKVRYLSRAQLLILIVIMAILSINILFIFQQLFVESDVVGNFIIPFATMLFIVGLWIFKKTGKIEVLAWIFFFLILFVLPVRLYYMGGPYSANNLSWIIAGMVMISAVHSRKITVLYIICSVVQVILLSSVDIPYHSSPQFAKVINFLLAYMLAALSLISIFKVQKFVLNESKNIVKVSSINIMMTTMSHEINNPLAIAMGTLEIMKKECGDVKELETIDRSLIRIRDIVKKIHSIEGVNELDLKLYASSKEYISLLDKKNW